MPIATAMRPASSERCGAVEWLTGDDGDQEDHVARHVGDEHPSEGQHADGIDDAGHHCHHDEEAGQRPVLGVGDEGPREETAAVGSSGGLVVHSGGRYSGAFLADFARRSPASGGKDAES
jgi:hypothetical protein